jgi:hypothetical protein
MTTTIAYPHDTATGLPDPLPTEALWGIAVYIPNAIRD